MTLYKHYKNKFYKYLGRVRHSETGESLVLYETRYESPGGRTWVRPETMFHEEIEWEGRRRPRFEPVVLELEQKTALTEPDLQAIAPVVEACFERAEIDRLRERLMQQERTHLVLGRVEGQVAGFKLGYPLDGESFYSLLGGVLPDFRGLGIAEELMRVQHDWCRSNGFRRVRTKSQNRYPAMLMLNIKSGFHIVGTEQSERGLKIVLEKELVKL